MKTNNELLAIAVKQLGNRGTIYQRYTGLSSSQPWCDAFVFWLFNANGCGSLLKWKGNARTSAPYSIQWCQKNLAQIPPYLGMACDIVYYDWEPNGRPNHVGICESRWGVNSIHAIEGNTNGGKVARKDRKGYIQAVFRPHFKPEGAIKKEKLVVDGQCGYKTIYILQIALGLKPTGILYKNTVMALQKRAGAKPDGAWGPNTSKAVQKLVGAGVDGKWGANSTKALQKWANKIVFPAKKAAAKTPASTSKPAAKAPVKKEEPKKTTAEKKHKSYRIDVDLTNQICTVYDVFTDKTSKPIMSEYVSTARKGKTTPTGNFKIQGASGGRKAKLRTAKMSSGTSYAEYLCRFYGSKCMHTVPYSKRQKVGKVSKSEFNKLGTPRSAGCVRMPNKLARFIYEKCPVGTPVKVFKGKKSEFPMGKPTKYKATTNQDPTYKK